MPENRKFLRAKSIKKLYFIRFLKVYELTWNILHNRMSKSQSMQSLASPRKSYPNRSLGSTASQFYSVCFFHDITTTWYLSDNNIVSLCREVPLPGFVVRNFAFNKENGCLKSTFTFTILIKLLNSLKDKYQRNVYRLKYTFLDYYVNWF